ncbi:MAG TPA: hypothetical protein VIN10_06495 [Bacteroidales bacterium]
MITRSEVLSAEQERKSLGLDFIALAIIYFIPALTHLFSFPLYYIEPMRIMVILAIAHTTKRNAYLLALTLPLFSLLVSGHPVFYKSLLMSVELSLNVFLFYQISKKVENQFFSMLVSVILSKTIYYVLKFALISFTILNFDLISTPLLIQLFIAVAVSAYVFIVVYRKKFDSFITDPTKDESLY